MPHHYTKEEKSLFSDRYFVARDKFSDQVLDMFDKQCPITLPLSVWPSNTPSGDIYRLANIAFFGIPALCILSKNASDSSLRGELSNALIRLSESNERLDIIHEKACLTALEDSILSFVDVDKCPMDTLQFILNPKTYTYLKKNGEHTLAKIHQLENEIDRLEYSKSKRDVSCAPDVYSKYDAETQRAINDKKNEIENCKTVIEKLRDSRYRLSISDIKEQLKNEEQIVINAEKKSLGNKWMRLKSHFEAHINTMQSRVDWMKEQEDTTSHDTLVIETVQNLKNTLNDAKDILISELQKPNAYQNREGILNTFILTCETAIRNTNSILEKDHTYNWRHLLADLMNTVTFIISASLSYWITGKFRLFTPTTHIMKNAYILFQDTKDEFKIVQDNASSLCVKDTDLSRRERSNALF